MPPAPEPPHPPTILLPSPSAAEPGLGVTSPVGMAPGMPATIAFSGEDALFEQRLSAVLAGAVEGLRFDAADFYLLDDRTAEMRIASSTLSTKGNPRSIEAAAGDLTAMAGEAVVLEDRQLMRQFSVPRRCGAAVCVPVSSDRTIHGSLWVYSKKPREVSNAELQLIEIVGGRLAVEVERRELLKSPASMPVPEIETSLDVLLPTVDLQFEELEIAGQTMGRFALHDWHALPDGRVLTYAASFVEAPGMASEEAGLTLQASRIALRSHAQGSVNTGRLLNRVAETLSEAGAGSSGVSLAAALVDPDTGEGSYSLAGAAAALRVRASQQSSEATDDPPLGWDSEQTHRTTAFELSIRERLLLATGSPRRLDTVAARKMAKGFAMVGADQHRRMNAWSTLDLAFERASQIGLDLESAVAVRRR